MTPSARMWTPCWKGRRNRNSSGSGATTWSNGDWALLQSLQNPWAHGYPADIMEPGMEVLTVTKSEVIKEFFKKSVLPVAVAALLYCIFKSACTKDGVTDYVWLFILCGLPFGIPRMFAWIVPGGSLGTALPLFLLNFIIGGVIGGFVLVWRLLVAVWYIFLTIYRINAECIL